MFILVQYRSSKGSSESNTFCILIRHPVYMHCVLDVRHCACIYSVLVIRLYVCSKTLVRCICYARFCSQLNKHRCCILVIRRSVDSKTNVCTVYSEYDILFTAK